MKKVIWHDGSFAEAVSTKCEMALWDQETGKVRHGAVRCKDFLADAYFSEAHKKDVSIYGYRWKPGVLSLDDPVIFAVREKGAELGPKEAGDMQTLYEAFDLPKGSYAGVVDDGHGSLVVTAGPWWNKAPWRISFMTLIARLAVNGKYSKKEDPMEFFERMTRDRVDGAWVKGVLEPVKIMLGGKVPEKLAKIGWADYKQAHDAHHGGGFYSTWTGKHTG